MPVWVDKLMHRAVSVLVDGVQASVDTTKGEACSQAFSQCRPPVRNTITADATSAGGICEGLSAYWIKYAKEGKTLKDWLVPNDKVDLDVLTLAQVLQSVGLKGQHNQTELSAKWLKTQGTSLKAFRQDIPNTSVGLLADEILAPNQGEYRMIGVAGTFGAHAMAAKVVAAGAVSFFDPNFGEFTFPSAVEFKDWFVNRYWSKAGYNVGLAKKWSVFSYA